VGGEGDRMLMANRPDPRKCGAHAFLRQEVSNHRPAIVPCDSNRHRNGGGETAGSKGIGERRGRTHNQKELTGDKVKFTQRPPVNTMIVILKGKKNK